MEFIPKRVHPNIKHATFKAYIILSKCADKK
jgi:hypothetical protein